ncbi:hypothetical protein CYMTET_43159 [Cymbomonas tetramitiformis]|uniref:Carboxypeptidase regulatory-like domain-containing protein n=1 Tax=Cymbomonas tetramitiformis TaxID=36881 RepID=A0AAE0C417_9CHLO|nr:hypothetical protein CYMTET_43159 [Cymbomonas tetramitiformis]|eukprot:gene4616-5655_t
MASFPQGLVFSIQADNSETCEEFLERCCRLDIKAPPTVPEDGVMSWELLGSSSSGIEIMQPHLILSPAYSIAIWFKPASKVERTPLASLLRVDNDALLLMDAATEVFGARLSDTSPGMNFEAKACADCWQLIILTGECSTSRRPNTGSTTCYTTLDPREGPQASGTVPVAFSGLPLTGVGRTGACLGWVSELHVWDRHLDTQEIKSFWLNSYPKHGVILPPLKPPVVDTWQVSGRVMTTANDVAADVMVGMPLPTNLSVYTDNRGYFHLDVPKSLMQAGASYVLSFEKEGFAPSIWPVDLSLPWVEVTLCAVAIRGKLWSAKGGTVQDPKTGMKLTVPPDAFVRSDGTAFTGEAEVSMSVVDPEDPLSLEAMPGDYTGISLDGSVVHMATYGALWVAVREADTQESLEIEKTGAGLSVEWSNDTPVNGFDRGGDFPTAWSFESTSGRWIQDENNIIANGVSLPISKKDWGTEIEKRRPKAGKKGKPRLSPKELTNDKMVQSIMERFRKGGKNSYQMKSIRKTGWWNCDCLFAHTIITGVILKAGKVACEQLAIISQSGEERVTGALQVYARGKDYRGKSYTRASPEDGRFNLVVQPGSSVMLQLKEPALGGQKQAGTSHGPFQSGMQAAIVDIGKLEILGA